MADDKRTRVKWTRAVKKSFIETYTELGSVRAALARLGISRSAAYTQRRSDPVFADQWREAFLASQERALDDAMDETHHGRLVEVEHADGTVTTRRQPASERTRAIVLQVSAKTVGAYHAAREADPEASIAARRRVRMAWHELAKSLGVLF